MFIRTARRVPPGAVITLLACTAWAQAPASDTEDFRKPLTPERLAAWVVESNAGLAATRAAAEAAAYRVETAGALDDPMLGYGVAPLTASADRSLNQRIEFSQKIPWPGTLAARESAARYDALAADRGIHSLRLALVFRAKAAYAEWRYVADALQVHRQTQALLDDLVAVAETRYSAGRASQQDVLHAEMERARLTERELKLTRQQTTVKAGINALLNRSPRAALPDALPIEIRGNVAPLSRFTSQALAQHPDLARYGAEIRAIEQRVTVAEKAFMPDFQVGVSYNSLWDEVDKRPLFGVSINVPLNRSKRRAEHDRARAELRRETFALADRRADLLANVADAHARLQESHAATSLYSDRLLSLAAQYLAAAIADYQSGSGAFLNVINAEQRKLETELANARARANYLQRYAELERWAGGPLETAQPAIAGDLQ